jgi:phytoene/squalene synthetase
LRDLKHDNEDLHRIYFPHLQGAELNQENKTLIIEEIENDFKEAYSGIQKLPNEAKFGVYTAYIYYMKLLQKLKKANAREIREERIRINNPTKIKLLVSSYVNYKLKLI